MVYIYKILNMRNGKFYIGSSTDYKRRWSQHIYELNKNIHCNKHLQNAWNKYGEENFDFEIIEECDDDKKFTREQCYLDNLNPFSPNGYNISINADGGTSKNENEYDKETVEVITYVKYLFTQCKTINQINKITNMNKHSLGAIKSLRMYKNIAKHYNNCLDNSKLIKNINDNSLIRFGLTVFELINKNNKNIKEIYFLKDVQNLLNDKYLNLKIFKRLN